MDLLKKCLCKSKVIDTLFTAKSRGVAYLCEAIESLTRLSIGGRGDGGSIPPATISKLRQFGSPHVANLCLSEETLKAGGPFYLVSMPGEIKDPTQGVNVQTEVDSLILEKDNYED